MRERESPGFKAQPYLYSFRLLVVQVLGFFEPINVPFFPKLVRAMILLSAIRTQLRRLAFTLNALSLSYDGCWQANSL